MFKLVLIYFIPIFQVNCDVRELFRNDWRNGIFWNNENNLNNFLPRQPPVSSPQYNYGTPRIPSNFYLSVALPSTTTQFPTSSSTVSTVQSSSTSSIRTSTTLRQQPTRSSAAASASLLQLVRQFLQFASQYPQSSNSWLQQSDINLFRNVWQQSNINNKLSNCTVINESSKEQVTTLKNDVQDIESTALPSIPVSSVGTQTNTSVNSENITSTSNDSLFTELNEDILNITETEEKFTTTTISPAVLPLVTTSVVNNLNSNKSSLVELISDDLNFTPSVNLQQIKQNLQLSHSSPVFSGNQQIQGLNKNISSLLSQIIAQVHALKQHASYAQTNNRPQFIPQNYQLSSNRNRGITFRNTRENKVETTPVAVQSNTWSYSALNPWKGFNFNQINGPNQQIRH